MDQRRRFTPEEVVNVLALSKDATAIYTTEDLIIQQANDAMIGFWGKDRSVIGKTFEEAVPELIGQPFFDLLKAVWRTGVTYKAENTAAQLRINGKLQWSYYDFEYRAIPDDQGNTYCILHTATDVTERNSSRKQIEDGIGREQKLNEELNATNEELAAANEELNSNMENLEAANQELLKSQDELLKLTNALEERVADRLADLSESEERFRNMAESSDVLIAVADESSNGVYFNKAWIELTGKTEKELLEFGWADLLHPEDKERWLNTYLDAAKKQIPASGEFRLLNKNGDYRWLLAKIPARFRSDGSFAGYISSCVDITDRKTNEQELEQIINILPAAVVVIRGTSLVVETINQANLAYWSKTKDEVIGKPLLEILPELASQAFPDQLRQVMNTGIIIDVKESPVLLINPDGTQRKSFVDYTYQPLTDVNGNRTGVLVMSFEITDRVSQRKLLEEYSAELQALNEELSASNEELAAVNEELLNAQHRIEERETALRLAIEAADFGTWFIHSVTREFITDIRLKELFGYYADEDLTIEGALAQITEEYRGYVSAALENAIYQGGDYDVTYPVVGLHDNRLRWLRAIGNLKADPSGAFSAFTGVVMDITEQYLAAKKVAEAEENLRMATESGELATWYLNENLGRIVASARFNELFGFDSDDEVPYAAAVTQIHPEYRQMVQDAVAASFSEGAHFNVEYPVTGYHDGKQRWLRSVGKFVPDEKSGNFITGVMADITEQKNDELRKNDFIAMVSHELKTPLTSLTAIVQVLKAKLKDNADPFVPGALDKANIQVKKMSNMINGFLNISRLESGKLLITKQDFDIDQLLVEMIDEAKITLSAHSFALSSCGQLIINADRDKIGSVVSNLLNNAVKYSPKGNRIEVKCERKANEVHISIKDEGIGIKPQDIHKLFERYYRVEGNHTKNISGFGIGLYLSAEIIKRHNGKIWAKSDFGIGSVFYFSLPVA